MNRTSPEIILVIEKGVHAGDGVAASAIRERREGQRNLLGEEPCQKPPDEVAVRGGTAVMSGPMPDQAQRHLGPQRRSQEDLTERLSESQIQRSKNHGAGLGDSKMSCAYPSIRWPS